MKKTTSKKEEREKLLHKFVMGKKNVGIDCRSCRACFGGPPRPRPRK